MAIQSLKGDGFATEAINIHHPASIYLCCNTTAFITNKGGKAVAHITGQRITVPQICNDKRHVGITMYIDSPDCSLIISFNSRCVEANTGAGIVKTQRFVTAGLEQVALARLQRSQRATPQAIIVNC